MIVHLSDTELKTLVIRMLTEMVEYGCEIKENVQGTNSDEKETGSHINVLDQKEHSTRIEGRNKNSKK